MKFLESVELGLKVVGVAVAVFGVWKYFDTQKQFAHTSAKERSLSYIERFGTSEVIGPRRTLLRFWQEHQGAGLAIRDGLMSNRGYRLFVAATYPASSRREETDDALFRLSVFLNEMAHCKATEICDAEILEAFFCDYATRFVPAYRPFYEVISNETGSAPLMSQIEVFTDECDSLSIGHNNE